MSRILNLIYSMVLGLRCRDVSNSFKLYRGNLLRGLPFAFKKRMFGSTKRSLIVFILSFIVTLLRLRFGR